MSGICVVTGVEDASDRVQDMLQRMSQFGQSCAQLSVRPDVACGRAWHGRLASEHAPEISAKGLVVLVDGEIFSEEGPVSNPEEIIARLYRSEKLDSLAHLNGSFSAIIVDSKKNLVILATDRLGTRPLFVWHSGRHLSVSSRLSSLLSDNRVGRRMSRQGIVELVALQRTTGGNTHFEIVNSTIAADIWIFSGDSVARRQTRRLKWSKTTLDQQGVSEQLTEGIRRSVRRRTSDPVRHGLLLSGGLDARAVLAADYAELRRLTCLTTGPFFNTEVSIAEMAASAVGAEFRFFENPPSELFNELDEVTIASDGLFTAPCNLFGRLPEMAQNFDVLLSGHGLDYTIRGYYLPCRTLSALGSRTRIPMLRRVPDGLAQTIAENMRVGIDEDALKRVFTADVRDELAERKRIAIDSAIESVETDSPYDAWDAYILSCVGRHYAYSDFVAMESVVAHRCITFDPDIFDVYLSMPPNWRASGKVAHKAMIALSPDLMAIPDANSGLRANIPFLGQTALILGRALLRRLRIIGRPRVLDPTQTQGSWANYGEVLRRASSARARLNDLVENSALLETGIFSHQGILDVSTEHLSGRKSHAKLLMQLLTLESWFGKNPPQDIADGH